MILAKLGKLNFFRLEISLLRVVNTFIVRDLRFNVHRFLRSLGVETLRQFLEVTESEDIALKMDESDIWTQLTVEDSLISGVEKIARSVMSCLNHH